MPEHNLENTILGKETEYKFEYDPGLLYPIARQINREKLGITGKAPFQGMDYWTAYEVSWLDDQGKPAVAIAKISVACDSENIVESKSLKLYFNSFNHSKFEKQAQVQNTIQHDLSLAFGGTVNVEMSHPNDPQQHQVSQPTGTCLDDISITTTSYETDPSFLKATGDCIEEQLYSHLMCSICPITNQPDWATVMIQYRGPKIDRAGLLKYIISFRAHGEFHEDCVERMFMDISTHCNTELLSVYARYTRRGGIDINPFRSNITKDTENQRLYRQ